MSCLKLFLLSAPATWVKINNFARKRKKWVEKPEGLALPPLCFVVVLAALPLHGGLQLAVLPVRFTYVFHETFTTG